MKTLEQAKNDYILEVLKACAGHTLSTARALGITTRTLYAWIKKHNVNHKAFWPDEYWADNHRRGRPRKWSDKHDN